MEQKLNVPEYSLVETNTLESLDPDAMISSMIKASGGKKRFCAAEEPSANNDMVEVSQDYSNLDNKTMAQTIGNSYQQEEVQKTGNARAHPGYWGLSPQTLVFTGLAGLAFVTGAYFYLARGKSKQQPAFQKVESDHIHYQEVDEDTEDLTCQDESST